jgi:hypothetical protein
MAIPVGSGAAEVARIANREQLTDVPLGFRRSRSTRRYLRCDTRTASVLGVREGATENAASCTELITDMRERGLRTDRAVLAVLAGSPLVRSEFSSKRGH